MPQPRITSEVSKTFLLSNPLGILSMGLDVFWQGDLGIGFRAGIGEQCVIDKFKRNLPLSSRVCVYARTRIHTRMQE